MKNKIKKEFIAVIFCFGLILCGFDAAPGATYIVSNNADSGAGSLRQAVLNANSTVSDDVIEFTSAMRGATITLASEIALGFGGNNGALTINGPGANRLVIDGGAGSNRIFQTAGVNTIRGVTLQNGGGPAFNDIGSAIRGNFGTIVLDGVVVQNNQSNQNGAVFFQLGSNHQIINSTITNNTAALCAGVRADQTSLTVVNSTFSGNNSTGAGGALCVWDASTAIIRNSTIANNAAGSGSQGGGGLQIFTSTVTFGNTIVAGNTAATGPDIHYFSGSIISAGGNVIGNNSTVSGAFSAGNPNGNGDKVGVSAALMPLGNYGGTTLTRALSPGSPAVDAGNNAAGTPPADQRGAARSGAVDAGAFEINQAAVFNLPAGRVNVGYNYIFTADSGALSYSLSGGSLPGGLNFSSNISPAAVVGLAGTPVFADTYNFAVTASDGTNSSVANYALVVLPAPTAAAVSISGRVLSSDGMSLSKAIVSLTDSSGNSRRALSSSFGYYRFEDVAVGEVYVLSVASKGRQFSPQVVSVGEEIDGLDFSALP
jgi:hypothetical protein